MINEQLYNKTVDILVQAYFNDTLEQGNCAACAVGNLVAANMGYTFINKYLGLNWKEVDAYDEDQIAINWYVPVKTGIKPNERQLREINSTGYSTTELRQIEIEFELAKSCLEEDDINMFNGLMAVIKKLDEIHENKDEQISNSAKSKFNKKQDVCV